MLGSQGHHLTDAEIVQELLSAGPGIQEEDLRYKEGNCPKMPEILDVHCC